jgi:Uma2 family endonuclease
MATTTAISLEEYLSTDYEWAPEWVDGELVEREMLNIPHSEATSRILRAAEDAGLWAGAQLGLPMGDRVRVPDVSVFLTRPKGVFPKHPPLVTIELLSPSERMKDVVAKCREYEAFGVKHIWVLDPESRAMYVLGPLGLNAVARLEIPEHNASFGPDDVFGPAA